MLAETGEVYALYDDHLVVVFHAQFTDDDIFDLLVVSGREVLHRGLDVLGRLGEAFPLRVLAQLLQDLLDHFCDHASSPRYSNRFLAVSTTVMRESRPVGSPGASVRQNARARLSPVVITPARVVTSSSFAWST